MINKMEHAETKILETSSIEIPKSNIEDTIDNVYKIHLNEEVVELSNEFCKYYYATSAEDQDEYLAIVFENDFIAPVKTIDFLSNTQIQGLNRLHSYSVVRLSSTKYEHLVAIVDSYEIEDTLASYLEKNKTINIKQVEEIVDNVTKVLSNLQDERIFCCNINPSNIIMRDGSFYAIREFIDSYPNFSQESQYLAPELVECHKAARYIESSKSDIYALGISIFEAYTANTHWKNHKNIEDYNFARFDNSTAKYLLNRVKVPERIREFFKGALHDNASLRWRISTLKDWVNGIITKTTHESLTKTKNTIGFNDNNYSSLKSLSHALFNYWNEATKFIKDDKLFKWASREQIDNHALNIIKDTVGAKSNSPFVVTNTVSSHTKLTKLLSMLDPNGPIRQEGLAFSAASIPVFLQYLLIHNKKDTAEKVVKLVKEDAWSQYPQEDAAGHLSTDKANAFQGHAALTQSNSPSRGVERLAYSLNPSSICYSALLRGLYITSIPELLAGLDSFAEKNPKKLNVDKHIVAFISSKLELREDIKSAILPNFPKFADHPVIRGLSILNVLQQHEPDIGIPNICKAITKDLIDLFQDHLHNVEFKKKITSQLQEIEKEGDISKIILMLSDQQQFINDYNGYYEACRKAKLLETKINNLNNSNNLFNNSLILGQKTTVLVSYVLCFIVTVTVIM